MRMIFNYIKFKFQKYSIYICIPLWTSLVYFMNRHQQNVTFRSSEENEVGKVSKFKNAVFHLQ